MIPPLRTVAIVGPESSGKSTLAAALAAAYNSVWVPEAARLFYERKGVHFEPRDIPDIAALHAELGAQARPKARIWLLRDTDLLTIELWSDWLYGDCDPAVRTAAAAEPFDVVLLLAPDLPWTYDPQRCHPEEGTRCLFHAELKSRQRRLGRRVFEISGEGHERFDRAWRCLQGLTVG